MVASAEACRGDEGNSPPSPAFVAAAERAARDTVLTPEDVPPSWRTEPDEPDTEDDLGLTGDCAYLNEPDEGFPGQVAFVNGDALIGPTHEINTEASVFASDHEAGEVMNKWFETFISCKDDVLERVRSDAGFGAGDEIEYEELDVAKTGDDTQAFRGTILLDGESSVIDFVSVREGHIVVTFIHGGRAENASERDQYVAVLAQKARAADDTLHD
jgi:hypothetical protein